MKITVRAKTKADKESVELKDGIYTVYIRERPIDGMANEAIIRALAKYFKVPKTTIRILTGKSGKMKIVEVS